MSSIWRLWELFTMHQNIAKIVFISKITVSLFKKKKTTTTPRICSGLVIRQLITAGRDLKTGKRFKGEGNGSPLQHSCLENSLDRGVWWATVCCFAKSQTGLKRHAHRRNLSGFPGGSKGKEPVCKCRRHRDMGLISKSRRSPGKNPVQYSCLENPMDRGAWQATVSP